ncbi:hypothetical protein JYA63_17380 [Fictibacillus nanhaiensis]|uniref:Uncharacterized protein n=1 Tax=Fictibacillus nanhaiensis TaxID=742169 RepID=A0ABS2ZXS0_9BACL|nr:hypothetical protein [Fictibacillus nanhaiensis]
MKYIEAILKELKEYAAEFTGEVISKEEFNLKMDLLIRKIDRIEINFIDTKLGLQPNIFNQLLFQRKFKATEALRDLQQQDRKRVFNAKTRKILANKLYFLSLYHTLKHNISKYQFREGKSDIDLNIQILIEGDQDHE